MLPLNLATDTESGPDLERWTDSVRKQMAAGRLRMSRSSTSENQKTGLPEDKVKKPKATGRNSEKTLETSEAIDIIRRRKFELTQELFAKKKHLQSLEVELGVRRRELYKPRRLSPPEIEDEKQLQEFEDEISSELEKAQADVDLVEETANKLKQEVQRISAHLARAEQTLDSFMLSLDALATRCD